jgi:hypothetical protein
MDSSKNRDVIGSGIALFVSILAKLSTAPDVEGRLLDLRWRRL